METTNLDKCKFCGISHGEDCGPQLFEIRHIYDLADFTESYVIEYEIRCLNCGISVHHEYADELIHMWNYESPQHETNQNP